MARKTIAQLREMEVEKLARFKNPNPTEDDIAEARRNMNSFYRLCGLAETNLYLNNEERTCNTKRTADSNAKEDRWHKRLDKVFSETYGLRLVYCGYAPSIGVIHQPGGGFSERITRWFYQ